VRQISNVILGFLPGFALCSARRSHSAQNAPVRASVHSSAFGRLAVGSSACCAGLKSISRSLTASVRALRKVARMRCAVEVPTGRGAVAVAAMMSAMAAVMCLGRSSDIRQWPIRGTR
jgi:hypothetical protein